MRISPDQYIKHLELLKEDLVKVMQAIPSGEAFTEAKVHADAIAPLIAGQLAMLQNASRPAIELNPSNPLALRAELDAFVAVLMDPVSRAKFTEYSAMLESLNDRG